MQLCGGNEISCGPGLFCNVGTYVFSSSAAPCAGGPEHCSCSPIPPSCDPPEESEGVWICARDHHTYPSICEAHRARTEIIVYSYEGRCSPPSDDVYACGSIFCRKGIHDCVVTSPVDDERPGTFECVPAGGAGGESGAAGGAGR